MRHVAIPALHHHALAATLLCNGCVQPDDDGSVAAAEATATAETSAGADTGVMSGAGADATDTSPASSDPTTADDDGDTASDGPGPTPDTDDTGSAGGFVTDGNPFAGALLYVDPAYAAKVQSSIDAEPADAAMLANVQGISTSIWLDRIAAIETVAPNLDAALALQQQENQAVTTVFTVYDLPNRDCAASSSAGELDVAEDGVARYRSEFIDPIAAEFAAHPDQRIVVILEPDSLPNLVTNLSVPKCAASEAAYRESVAYAIATLSMPHVYIYLDAAHSGWLGWAPNQTGAAQVFAEVLQDAGGADLIRGFATNVSNYTVLDEVPELYDAQGNPCRDEHTFVAQLGAALDTAGVTGKSFVIDTSRNGRGGIRDVWGHWCNLADAGLGERPRADPRERVDAYYWVKPPGDSDGTSDPNAPRFDPSCISSDSASNAPQAGAWFHDAFVELAHNANPAL